MMKVRVLLGVMAVAGTVSGCLGGGEKDPEPTAVERCQSGCEQATDCGYEDFDQDECDVYCDEAFDEADEAGCADEWSDLARCADAAFECDGDGSACEGEAEDFASCILDS